MKKKRIGGVLAAAGAAAVLSGLCTGRAFCLDMESYAGLLDKERMSGETEYMVSGDQECRRLLMELVSAGAGKEREEFFITGEDYEPETLVIAQMFPAAVNISNTKIEEYEENGRRYVTCRIGFERQPDQEACTHRWETRILEAGTCLWGGKEELTCRLCGLRKVRSPAALGHLDADRDRLCDRCRDPLNGDEPIETGRWGRGRHPDEKAWEGHIPVPVRGRRLQQCRNRSSEMRIIFMRNCHTVRHGQYRFPEKDHHIWKKQ